MTTKEFANMIDGRHYPLRLTAEEIDLAIENEIIIVYGHSDDLVEINGIFSEEHPSDDLIFLNKEGIIKNECNNEDCQYFRDKLRNTGRNYIDPEWCKTDEYDFTYDTDIRHDTFDIYEDEIGNKYCKGLVFSLDDLSDASFYTGKITIDICQLREMRDKISDAHDGSFIQLIKEWIDSLLEEEL